MNSKESKSKAKQSQQTQSAKSKEGQNVKKERKRWNNGEHNDGRGKLGYIQPPKMRRCNNCGYEAKYRSGTHKVWCKKTKRNVFCGTMRVIR